MTTTIKQCEYIISKGLRKGLNCITKKIFCDGLCKTHYKNKKDIKIIEPKIELKIQPKKSKLLSLPYDILEKIIYKPRINKELQLIFNKNIPYLYEDFINTTKNIDIIKLSICQDLVYYEIVYDDCIYRYRNPRKEIWTKYKSIDEMYNIELKNKIDVNNMWSNKNNHYNNLIKLYNKILNKYKLYNKLFIKNILYNESYDTRLFILDDSNKHIKNILVKCYKYIETNLVKNLLKYDVVDDCFTNIIIDFKNNMNDEDIKKILYKRHKNQSIEDRLKWYISINIHQVYDDIDEEQKIDIVKLQNILYKSLLYYV